MRVLSNTSSYMKINNKKYSTRVHMFFNFENLKKKNLYLQQWLVREMLNIQRETIISFFKETISDFNRRLDNVFADVHD